MVDPVNDPSPAALLQRLSAASINPIPAALMDAINAPSGTHPELDAKFLQLIRDELTHRLTPFLWKPGRSFTAAATFPVGADPMQADVLIIRRTVPEQGSQSVEATLHQKVIITHERKMVLALEREVFETELHRASRSQREASDLAEAEFKIENADQLREHSQKMADADDQLRFSQEELEEAAHRVAQRETYIDQIGDFRILPGQIFVLQISASVQYSEELVPSTPVFRVTWARHSEANAPTASFTFDQSGVSLSAKGEQENFSATRKVIEADRLLFKTYLPALMNALGLASHLGMSREGPFNPKDFDPNRPPSPGRSSPSNTKATLVEEDLGPEGEELLSDLLASVPDLIKRLDLAQPELFAETLSDLSSLHTAIINMIAPAPADPAEIQSMREQYVAEYEKVFHDAIAPATAALQPGNRHHVRAAAAIFLHQLEIYEPAFESALLEAIHPAYRRDNYALPTAATKLLSLHHGTLSESGMHTALERCGSPIPELARVNLTSVLYSCNPAAIRTVLPQITTLLYESVTKREEMMGRALLFLLKKKCTQSQFEEQVSSAIERMTSGQMVRLHNWTKPKFGSVSNESETP